MNKLFDLSGKKALVTGCNRGIGKAMAVALAEAGAQIIGVSAGLALSGSEVEREVMATGSSFHAYRCDFGNRDSLYQFIGKVREEHKKVDILVNNAGTIMRKPAVEHPDSYWDNVLSINLDATFLLTREFGKEMLDRSWGKIVMICSMLSYQGGINVPSYTASKAGMAGLVKAFACEWAGMGVNVNGIAPGYVSTDNTAALREDEERNRSILARIPAGRWGEPEDFKGAIQFLCSDASAYVHGTLVNVDGGWMG